MEKKMATGDLLSSLSYVRSNWKPMNKLIDPHLKTTRMYITCL